MILNAKKRLFSLWEWDNLTRHNLANIRTLITLKNEVNKDYYQKKELHGRNMTPEEKRSAWFLSLRAVFKKHYPQNQDEQKFKTYCDAVTKINNRLQSNTKERKRFYLAQQLDLKVHEQQLFAPGLAPESEEFEEFKEKILNS